MATLGYTLFSEINRPGEMIRQAVDAEQAGFDFLAMSDHFHPWLSSHTDSPFAWTVWGAVADRTESVKLMSLVTCPFLRYHPAIVAQAAATVQDLSGGRFTLGLGSGEQLNEHVVGRGWPAVDVRHRMLRESVEIMRRLWTGEWTTYRGEHLTVEDARLFTLPEESPAVAIAGSGPASLDLAVEVGDALVAIDPDADLVERFKERSGGGRVIGQVAIAWDPDDAAALEHAYRFAFGAHGWKVMAELPNVANFDADVGTVGDDTIRDLVAVGPDPDVHAATIRPFLEAGFDEVCIVQVGDRTGSDFFDWWTGELRPLLDA